MTDFNDPLTGEKVQASINEWEAVLDLASQNTEDLIRWINGEITNTQIANGQYMTQWLQASAARAALSTRRPSCRRRRSSLASPRSIDRTRA